MEMDKFDRLAKIRKNIDNLKNQIAELAMPNSILGIVIRNDYDIISRTIRLEISPDINAKIKHTVLTMLDEELEKQLQLFKNIE
jgi:hypothetical protein